MTAQRLLSRTRKRLFGRVFGSMLSDNAFALRRCVGDILAAEDIEVTARECTVLLTACSKFKDGATALHVLRTYEERYAAAASADEPTSAAERAWRPNVRHYTATIAACARGGALGDGLRLLRRMEGAAAATSGASDAAAAPVPNTATYNALLFGCRSARRPLLARGLLRRMRRRRLVPDARTCTALLVTLGDAHEGAAAVALLDELLSAYGAAIVPSVALFNAAIGSCANAKLKRRDVAALPPAERATAERAGAALMLAVATELLAALCAAPHGTVEAGVAATLRGAATRGASEAERADAARKAAAIAALREQPPSSLDYYMQRLSLREVEHELHARGLSTIGNRRELAERLRADRRAAYGYDAAAEEAGNIEASAAVGGSGAMGGATSGTPGVVALAKMRATAPKAQGKATAALRLLDNASRARVKRAARGGGGGGGSLLLRPDALTYAAFLRCCAAAGDAPRALQTLEAAEADGIQLSRSMLTAAAIACARAGDIKTACSLLYDVRRRGYVPKPLLHNAIAAAAVDDALAHGVCGAPQPPRPTHAPWLRAFAETLGWGGETLDGMSASTIRAQIGAASAAGNDWRTFRSEWLKSKGVEEPSASVVVQPTKRRAAAGERRLRDLNDEELARHDRETFGERWTTALWALTQKPSRYQSMHRGETFALQRSIARLERQRQHGDKATTASERDGRIVLGSGVGRRRRKDLLINSAAQQRRTSKRTKVKGRQPGA